MAERVTATTPSPRAGNQTVITANYQGNSTYANSAGSNSFGSTTIDVQKSPTMTAITSVVENPIPSIQLPSGVTAYSMTFTATVTASGSSPILNGSITFTKGGQTISCSGSLTVIGTSPRSATCTDDNPEDFRGPIVASYSGDPNLGGLVVLPCLAIVRPRSHEHLLGDRVTHVARRRAERDAERGRERVR